MYSFCIRDPLSTEAEKIRVEAMESKDVKKTNSDSNFPPLCHRGRLRRYCVLYMPGGASAYFIFFN
jgi:hypothetical protein